MQETIYVAHDAATTIVSTRRLTVRGGWATVRRQGAIVQLSPVESALGGRGLRSAGLAVAAGSGLAAWSGMPWWPAVTVVGVALFVLGYASVRNRSRRGIVAALGLDRHRDDHHVLVHPAERQAFAEAMDLADRSVNSFSELGPLVDEQAAHQFLARALHDLARLLACRQQVRAVARDAAARLGAALSALDAEVDRHLADLEQAAVAGAEYAEQHAVEALAREIDDVLARWTASETAAGRTEAVLRAYRELDSRHDLP